MKKSLCLAIFCVVALGFVGTVKAVILPKFGSNFVDVAACEQVGKDIRVSLKSGQKYTLTSTIRDAGHGLRDYKLTCVSTTKYKVEWTEVVTSTTTTAPVATPTATSTPVANNTVKSGDTTSPEIVFSGRYSGKQLNMNVYAVDAKQQSAIVKIEVYQQGGGNMIFSWSDNTATSKDVWKHFQNDDYNAEGSPGFIAKAYDKAGNVGVSETLILPTNMDHLRVVNPSLSWIYNNILMKNTSVQKNGLKRFYVFTGNTYNKNKMQMVATCTTLMSGINNFSCSYFKPDKLKASGYGYILALDNTNKFSSFPVMPFSW